MVYFVCFLASVPAVMFAPMSHNMFVTFTLIFLFLLQFKFYSFK